MAEADRLYPGDVVAAQVGTDLWWSLRGLTLTQKWRNREGFDQNKMVMVNMIFPKK